MAGNGRHSADSVLVLALAAGATVQDAATQAGISERTVHRRLEDAEFRRSVADARGVMVRRAVGKLADASTAAVDTLRDLLDAGGDSARLGAARAILELGSKLRESLELEERIAALEGAAHGAEGPR